MTRSVKLISLRHYHPVSGTVSTRRGTALFNIRDSTRGMPTIVAMQYAGMLGRCDGVKGDSHEVQISNVTRHNNVGPESIQRRTRIHAMRTAFLKHRIEAPQTIENNNTNESR
jgi:hypothetical protein